MKYFLNEKSIDEIISVENKKKTIKTLLIEKNQLVLNQIFNIVKLFGKLTFPFRGHYESTNSCNKSVFK